MSVKVETFEELEINELGEFDNQEECVSLIESMDLSGQKQLLSSDKKQVMPYRIMKEDEKFTYEMICPEVSKAEEYSSGPIPLRVLQVLSHARELEYFDKIEIWAATSAVIKDPVLVGVKTINYDSKYHILARWGEELEELDILKRKACKIAKDKSTVYFKRVIAMCKSKLAEVEETEGACFTKKEEIAPTIYDHNITNNSLPF